MEFSQLRYFVAVVENGTTAKAAARLQVSQSTVSKAILHLEQELTMPLFERRGSHLYLSPTGDEFLQQIRPVLATMDALPEQMLKYHRPAPRLRINLSAAHPAISGLLHAYLSCQPNTMIEVSSSDWMNNCDLSITSQPTSRKEDSVFLLREEILLAVPNRFPLSKESEASPQALRSMPLLLPESGYSLRREIDLRLASTPALFRPQVASADWTCIQRLTETGVGAAFWPAKTWPKPDASAVTLLHLGGEEFTRSIYALLPPTVAPSTEVLAFLECAQKYCHTL